MAISIIFTEFKNSIKRPNLNEPKYFLYTSTPWSTKGLQSDTLGEGPVHGTDQFYPEVKCRNNRLQTLPKSRAGTGLGPGLNLSLYYVRPLLGKTGLSFLLVKPASRPV